MILRSLKPALAAAVSCCLLLPAAALAADGEGTPLDLADPAVRSTKSAAGGGGGGLVRTIVGLAIVIGVIYGLHWILKQVKASREESHSGTGLGTMATLPLGPNRSLHLVRAGSELVLVGVGEHGVTPIRTYSDQEARTLGLVPDEPDDDEDVASTGPFGGGSATLGARVGAALTSRGKPRPAAPGVGGPVSRLLSDLRSRTVIR